MRDWFMYLQQETILGTQLAQKILAELPLSLIKGYSRTATVLFESAICPRRYWIHICSV